MFLDIIVVVIIFIDCDYDCAYIAITGGVTPFRFIIEPLIFPLWFTLILLKHIIDTHSDCPQSVQLYKEML